VLRVARRESTEGTLGCTATASFHGEIEASYLGQLRPPCHASRAESENEKTTGVPKAKCTQLLDREDNAREGSECAALKRSACREAR
jgi:hypothetical protein